MLADLERGERIPAPLAPAHPIGVRRHERATHPQTVCPGKQADECKHGQISMFDRGCSVVVCGERECLYAEHDRYDASVDPWPWLSETGSKAM